MYMSFPKEIAQKPIADGFSDAPRVRSVIGLNKVYLVQRYPQNE